MITTALYRQPIGSGRMVLMGFQAADLLSTLWVFRLGGYEANPITASALSFLGPMAGLVAIKLLACLLILRLRSKWLLRCAIAFYGATVAWNCFVVAVAIWGK